MVRRSKSELGSLPAPGAQAPRVPAGCSRAKRAGTAASPDGEPPRGGKRAGRRLASPERKAPSSGSGFDSRSPPRLSVFQGRSGPGLHHRSRPTQGHSPHLATPVGMGTPSGAGSARFPHPSAMTPHRSAKRNFRAEQKLLEP